MMEGMTMWMLWLAVAVVLVIVEIFTSSAIALGMAVGAVAAFAAALAGASPEVQLIVLAVSMVAGLIIVTPLMRRYNGLIKPDTDAVSNMDALIGRVGTVVLSGDNPDELGRVKIDGDRWQVRSSDGSRLTDGQRVEVCGYESIVLLVKPVKK